jgi:acyl phosphate:glycerol-3-phosphate acyltransferase
MMLMLNILFVLLAYLLGSIPFGYLLTRHYTGKNILELGSRTMGSTNVGRIVGKKASLFTQLLDMAKGLLPVAVYLLIAGHDSFIYGLALASIIGHDFSVFLKFKGGKGVNTTLGASVLIAPIPVFIAVAIYFIVKGLYKYVSLGSIILGISLPLIDLIFHGVTATFYYLLVCTILIIISHRANIIRLINHQELSS